MEIDDGPAFERELEDIFEVLAMSEERYAQVADQTVLYADEAPQA